MALQLVQTVALYPNHWRNGEYSMCRCSNCNLIFSVQSCKYAKDILGQSTLEVKHKISKVNKGVLEDTCVCILLCMKLISYFILEIHKRPRGDVSGVCRWLFLRQCFHDLDLKFYFCFRSCYCQLQQNFKAYCYS